MNRIWFSGFLFANPSFLEGAARCFDLGDTLTVYNSAPTGADADVLALTADKLAVAADLREVLTGLRDDETQEATRNLQAASAGAPDR